MMGSTGRYQDRTIYGPRQSTLIHQGGHPHARHARGAS